MTQNEVKKKKKKKEIIQDIIKNLRTQPRFFFATNTIQGKTNR